MKFFSALFATATLAATVAVRAADHQAHATETCADPNLTSVYFDMFSPTRTAHAIRAQMDMIYYNKYQGTNDNFQFVAPAFRAWTTAQNFTTPFYQLTSEYNNEFLFLLEENGKAPSASGFILEGIVGYAYSTQVCGSVPLYSANDAVSSDNYWTTNQADHNMLVADGWVDTGISFYVLPLDTCGCSSSSPPASPPYSPPSSPPSSPSSVVPPVYV